MKRPFKLVPPEPSEAEIQAALMRRLRLRGWLVVRINGGGFKTPSGFFWAYIVQGLNLSKGFPDVLALRGHKTRRGVVEARLFEVKKQGGRLSLDQQRFAAFARLCGVEVEVVEGWGEMEAAVACCS